MKTVCILLAITMAAVCAVPITEDVQYMNAQPKDLLKPLDDIVAEINAEAKEDQDQIDKDASKLKYAKSDEAGELAKTKDAEKAMNDAHKALDDQTTLQNKREQEYAENNEVRAREQASITKVEDDTVAVEKLGPVGGVMGELPASKVIIEKKAEEKKGPAAPAAAPAKANAGRRLLSAEVDQIIEDLQRPNKNTGEIKAAIAKARAAIKAEDDQDKKEVEVQIAKTRAALKVYNDKKADYETAIQKWEEAKQRTAIAQTAYDSSVKDKAEADKLRAEEIKVIDDAKKMVSDLIAVRSKPATLVELQEEAGRQNSATQKLKDICVQLRKDVNLEETMQLRLLNMMKARELAARNTMKAAETKYNAQKIATAAAYKRFEKSHGEWEGSEMALAQEQAVANAERKMINNVREMMKKLNAASLKTLGNCPTDKDGTVCSGQGQCQKEKNGLGAKCKCTGFGKTGFDCSLCKFGFKDVNGACTKVFETAVSFLQVDGKDYTADDMNDLITLMQEGRANKVQEKGIEKLLQKLEAKLDAQEKMLIEEATKAKDVRDIFDKHWVANKTQEAADKKDWEAKTVVWKKAVANLRVVQTMYDLEHPLRMKELEIITLLDKVILRLEGKAVHNGTPAPTAQATKSNFKSTSAPTTK